MEEQDTGLLWPYTHPILPFGMAEEIHAGENKVDIEQPQGKISYQFMIQR